MRGASKYILFTGLCISLISVVYFFALVCGLPLVVTTIAIAAAAILLFRYLPGAQNDTNKKPYAILAYIFLAAGLYFIVANTNAHFKKHGDWDAWAIWNNHAAFLRSPEHWRNMLANTTSHPDYPLCLPATIAFFQRLAGPQLLIPFLVSFVIMFWIPVIIYIEHYKKNIVIALAALLFFATNESYIIRGLSQYADTMLAFFFLAALVCMNYAEENKKYISLAAAFLGCCMWTKNEGIVLAVIFCLFYIDVLFAPRNIKYTLGGIALPFAALLTFKLAYAPANDMVAGQAKTKLSELLTLPRAKMIWDFFKVNLGKHFTYIKPAFCLYILACIMQRKWPERQMWLLICCMLAYFLIYMITPRDLEWQLATSQDRLMHQLMPAMMYVIVSKLAEIKLLQSNKQAL